MICYLPVFSLFDNVQCGVGQLDIDGVVVAGLEVLHRGLVLHRVTRHRACARLIIEEDGSFSFENLSNCFRIRAKR